MIGELIVLSAALFGGSGTVEVERAEAKRLLEEALKRSETTIRTGLSSIAEKGKKIGSFSILSENERSDGSLQSYTAKFGDFSFSFDPLGYLQANDAKETYAFGNETYESAISLDSLAGQPGFALEKSLSPIPSLMGQYDGSFWGNWSIVSFPQDYSECSVVSAMDLLYTYKLSGRGCFIAESAVSEAKAALLGAMGGTSVLSLGVSEDGFLAGMNSYLHDSSASFAPKDFNGSAPTIGLYQSPNGAMGHIAMVFGRAETTPFWNFKKQYDIVVSFNRNYLGKSEPTSVNMSSRNTIFGIESCLRKSEFGLSFTIPGC